MMTDDTMATTMKAALVTRPGGPEVLTVRDIPRPKIKPGWSVVKVMGFGVNHSEIFTRQGLSPSVHFPRILGIKCVGVVEESSDPNRLPTGTVVASLMGEMGRAFDGSYAQYTLLPNDQIFPIKSDLPWPALAAIPETFYTAFLAYRSLKIQEGDRILVRGGSSGVGIAFLHLVKARFPQIPISGSVRSLSKRERLLRAGFGRVLPDRNRKLILHDSDTFTKVLELIGPATIKDSISHMEEGGIVCSAGQLGGIWYLQDFDPIMELQKTIYLTTAYSGRVTGETIQEMFDFIDRYQVPVEPEKVFTLDGIAQAHAYLEGKSSFGKVVVLPQDKGEY